MPQQRTPYARSRCRPCPTPAAWWAAPAPILDGKYVTSGIAQGFAAGRQSKVPLIDRRQLQRGQPGPPAAGPAGRRARAAEGRDPQGVRPGRHRRQGPDHQRRRHRPADHRARPHAARLHAKAGQPAYLYYFSHVAPAAKARKPYGAGLHRRDPLCLRRAHRAGHLRRGGQGAVRRHDASTGPTSPRPAIRARRAASPGRSSTRPRRRQVEFGDERRARRREHFLGRGTVGATACRGRAGASYRPLGLAGRPLASRGAAPAAPSPARGPRRRLAGAAFAGAALPGGRLAPLAAAQAALQRVHQVDRPRPPWAPRPSSRRGPSPSRVIRARSASS